MEFAKVQFYGRRLQEYKDMFNLEDGFLQGKRVLDCPSGPASFVAEATKAGVSVTGVDPVYAMNFDEMLAKAKLDIDAVLVKLQSNHGTIYAFTDSEWQTYTDNKLAAFRLFQDDFLHGMAERRYIAAQLPNLPFADNSFDLALCANFLFLYMDSTAGGIMEHSPFDVPFTVAAILELLRVCPGDVRVYPLHTTETHRRVHPCLDAVMQQLQAHGVKYELRTSTYFSGNTGLNLTLHLSKPSSTVVRDRRTR